MARLRFHWDFFGPDAEATAMHFLKHVDEFCAREGIQDHRGFTTMVQARCVASVECDEVHLVLIRDRLKPKRAERLA
jgi:uncharacterized protein